MTEDEFCAACTPRWPNACTSSGWPSSRSSDCLRAEDVYLFLGPARENPRTSGCSRWPRCAISPRCAIEQGRSPCCRTSSACSWRRSRRSGTSRRSAPSRRRLSGTGCCSTCGRRSSDLARDRGQVSCRSAPRPRAGDRDVLDLRRMRDARWAPSRRVIRFFSPPAAGWSSRSTPRRRGRCCRSTRGERIVRLRQRGSPAPARRSSRCWRPARDRGPARTGTPAGDFVEHDLDEAAAFVPSSARGR